MTTRETAETGKGVDSTASDYLTDPDEWYVVEAGAGIPVLAPVAGTFRAPRWWERIWPWGRFYDGERRLHQQRYALHELGKEVNALCSEVHELRVLREKPSDKLAPQVRDQRILIGELNEANQQLLRVAKARAEQLRRAGIEPIYETEAQRKRRNRVFVCGPFSQQ
jgi:hypothetical protein